MKALVLLASAVPVITFCSCSSTTVVKPEPTTVSESATRRTSTSTMGGMPMSSTTAETHSVTTQ